MTLTTRLESYAARIDYVLHVERCGGRVVSGAVSPDGVVRLRIEGARWASVLRERWRFSAALDVAWVRAERVDGGVILTFETRRECDSCMGRGDTLGTETVLGRPVISLNPRNREICPNCDGRGFVVEGE